MPHAQTPNLRIYHERAGAGPPLLFISGTGGDLRAKPNVFDSSLPQHFDLLAYDQRGLGRTERPPGPYTMRDFADDAAALLDALGWDRCRVLGVSFGGMVAQEFALRHPSRVERLVLACTSSGGEGGASYPLHELQALPVEERARRMMALNDNRFPALERENPDRYARILQMTLDAMYRALPRMRYDIIVLRSHAASYSEDPAQPELSQDRGVALFTNEPYSTQRYVDEQRKGLVAKARQEEASDAYFALDARFVNSLMEGTFGRSTIVLLGCAGLRTPAFADALHRRGASEFVSWSDDVSAEHNDIAGASLIANLAKYHGEAAPAVRAAMAEAGPDPAFGSRLLTYP